MVLMTMCDDDSLNLVSPLCYEGGVWKDLVHAQVGKAAHRARQVTHLRGVVSRA